MLSRLSRSAYTLAVTLGLAPYKWFWPVQADTWDESYDSGFLDFYGILHERPRYGVLLSFIQAHGRPVRILDIGCGKGLLRDRIPDDYIAGYIGLDPSKVALDAAIARNHARSEFVVAYEPTPEMGQFDIIIANEVLNYVEDLPHLFSLVDRHLAPDGRFLTSIYGHPGDIALHRALRRHFNELEGVKITRPRHGKQLWRVAMYASRQT